MKITSTLRGNPTDLVNETSRVKQIEDGFKFGQNRFQNDKEKFYSTELSYDDLAKMVFCADESALKRLEIIIRSKRAKIESDKAIECVKEVFNNG